ncbi:MAG: PQQ-dependent sugar dehydrogenase [Chloroflexi bacterium]|nr:MAG: PQQ-dependent sugar dehydrogenase [Chloroflexota bacterium]TME48729.1 MAG: PQQ-dependent sugar dehydrogenase [Chloroflexota bacterium]
MASGAAMRAPIIAVALLLLASCQSGSPTPPAASRSPSATPQPSARLSTYLSANFATALAWAPDGRLFYAQRGGSIATFDGKAARAFASVSPSTSGERGLLGLAISPTFSSDHYVYAFYSRSDDESRQRVVRWTDQSGTGAQLTTIIDNLPAGTDCCHKGGRLAFGPDRKLYVSLGENHLASQAQDPSSLRGKILRYNADGTVPADNPFGSSNPVWAIGLRNPFGLAFSPDGKLFVTDNGPSGDDGSPPTGYDRVLQVVRGGNSQWPVCYGNSIPLHASNCPGTPPTYQSGTTTLVPTGASFVSGKGPAGYQGDFVFCSYAQDRLKVMSPDGRQLLFDGPACQLDVKEGPDHALYFSDTASIYRLGS